MTIFATRGEGMKLVIDGNFIARKMKNQKFWGKLMLGSSKKKQRTCRFQIHVGKVWIFEKNQFFEFFSIFAKGGTLWCQNSKFSFFNLLKFRISFFKSSLTGTKGILKWTKSWILVTLVIKLWKWETAFGRPGPKWPPLVGIGLRNRRKLLFP